jgi:hypothetical protein
VCCGVVCWCHWSRTLCSRRVPPGSVGLVPLPALTHTCSELLKSQMHTYVSMDINFNRNLICFRNDPIYKNMELWQDTVKKTASVSNACLGEFYHDKYYSNDEYFSSNLFDMRQSALIPVPWCPLRTRKDSLVIREPSKTRTSASIR